MVITDICMNILLASGLIFYLAFTGYSLWMVYNGILEHNSHWVTKILYSLGLFNVALWTLTFTGMLVLKLGGLF